MVGAKIHFLYHFIILKGDKISPFITIYSDDPWSIDIIFNVSGKVLERFWKSYHTYRQSAYVLLFVTYLFNPRIALFAPKLSGYHWTEMISQKPLIPVINGYGFPLATVYIVWIIVVLLLYPLCQRYERYKSAHKKWWLSYL